MSEDVRSLHQIYPKNHLIPVALFFSALFLAYGLFLPVITLKELIFWRTTFSVITGIENLFYEGHYFLTAVILLFSVCFPILKLSVLVVIWFRPVSKKFRTAMVEWLGSLGKWSMLDVFVVAMMVIITKISGFASAQPRIGIYFFGASVFLAMLTTERINFLLKTKKWPAQKN